MKRADIEAHGATFAEECEKVGPGGCRFGIPTVLEFPVFERLRPLSMDDVDDVGDPNDSSISRGAFRFESNLFARRASFTLSIRDWLAASEVRTFDLAHDGRLDRHQWRLCINMAVEQLIRAAVAEGVVGETR